MFTIRMTDKFDAWLKGLRDRRAANRILDRIVRAEGGNLGDVKVVGDGVSEMRIAYGPGYRLYFIQHGSVVIVLLCGGDKRTQKRDIAEAKRLAKEWKE
ncbi:MAG: type II toxin-antitoxin system RelE/ParE family toxin [Shinella sp.]|nr:type II toxin-antitoxin system RelE/ParE family toxin [Shinella sp.]